MRFYPFVPVLLSIFYGVAVGQDESDRMTVSSSSIEIVGTATGGTVSIGVAGSPSKQVTVTTAQGDSTADIAQRLATAAPNSQAPFANGVTAAGAQVKISNTQLGDIFIKSTDLGINQFSNVSNFTTTPSSATKSVTLKWTVPDPAPAFLYIFKSNAHLTSVDASAGSYVDSDFDTDPDGQSSSTTYSVIAGYKNASGGITRFSDIIRVRTCNPVFMVNDVFSIASTGTSNGKVGSAFSQTMLINGGVAPITWSVINGSLPLGLALSGDGIISGAPTTVGTSNFTLKSTDSTGATSTKDFSIKITKF